MPYTFNPHTSHVSKHRFSCPGWDLEEKDTVTETVMKFPVAMATFN